MIWALLYAIATLAIGLFTRIALGANGPLWAWFILGALIGAAMAVAESYGSRKEHHR